MTAEEIAEYYGVIRGRVARMVESGEAKRLIDEGKAEKREYVLGSRPVLVFVSETLIEGTPYRISAVRREYFDPIPQVADVAVQKIRYGPEEEDEDKVLTISSPEEIDEVLKCFRGESYEKKDSVADRLCVLDNMRIVGSRGKIVGRFHGCSTGIRIFAEGRQVAFLDGHLRNGWLGAERRLHNDYMLALFRRIASRHGYVPPDWF